MNGGRITKENLENLVKNINKKLNLGENEKLYLEYAYGGVRLVKRSGENGCGCSDISFRGTKKEIYNHLITLENMCYAYDLIKK